MAPVAGVPREGRLPLFLLLLFLTAGLIAVLVWTLRGERHSIVALELAGTVGKARQIISCWEASGARGALSSTFTWIFRSSSSTRPLSPCAASWRRRCSRHAPNGWS